MLIRPCALLLSPAALVQTRQEKAKFARFRACMPELRVSALHGSDTCVLSKDMQLIVKFVTNYPATKQRFSAPVASTCFLLLAKFYFLTLF